ncbi:hypothetical protein [Bacillus toyonensis]|uniref:hypothetical protein n=1 Tax=Bacillus toyonensis TaxID=155322 RepID=UPI001155FF7A|nr:hypothetical protein [Bacillus toyonensis]
MIDGATNSVIATISFGNNSGKIEVNSTLQIRNNSIFNKQNIVTCASGVNAIELTIPKLN